MALPTAAGHHGAREIVLSQNLTGELAVFDKARGTFHQAFLELQDKAGERLLELQFSTEGRVTLLASV